MSAIQCRVFIAVINLSVELNHRYTPAEAIGDTFTCTCTGADPGFQVRGGALKKIAPSGGRRENFWGISCEKSRFYAKKSYFFQLTNKTIQLLNTQTKQKQHKKQQIK